MGKKRKDRLRVLRTIDVPLREVSGICVRRACNHQMSLVAVGDRVAEVAWLPLPCHDLETIEWQTKKLGKLPGSEIARDHPQIEAVCADGTGRIIVLQETPPRAEVVDLDASRTTASIDLVADGDDEFSRAWSDADGSGGEGFVLLPNGHLLVAKEKKPAALIEFGTPGSRSQGLVRGGALEEGARWGVEKGRHEFVPLAVWFPDERLAEACKDFSDLEIGPDGRLYVLSDQSATIARLDDLKPGGGTAAATTTWRLEELNGKPEGLAFTTEGRAIVALDKRKPRKNLVLLEPAIAI